MARRPRRGRLRCSNTAWRGTPSTIISGAPQPYTVARDAKADALRAVRVIRSRAAEWGVDPEPCRHHRLFGGGRSGAGRGPRRWRGRPERHRPGGPARRASEFSRHYLPRPTARKRVRRIGRPRPISPTFFLCASNDPSATVSGAPGPAQALRRPAHRQDSRRTAHLRGRGHGFGVRPVGLLGVHVAPNFAFRGLVNDRGI